MPGLAAERARALRLALARTAPRRRGETLAVNGGECRRLTA